MLPLHVDYDLHNHINKGCNFIVFRRTLAIRVTMAKALSDEHGHGCGCATCKPSKAVSEDKKAELVSIPNTISYGLERLCFAGTEADALVHRQGSRICWVVLLSRAIQLQ